MTQAAEGQSHTFMAVAFVDDLPLSSVAALLSGPRTTPHDVYSRCREGGEVFAFPFGALVFHDVGPAVRDALMAELRRRHPRLVPDVVREDFNVLELPGAKVGMAEGRLVVDRLGTTRAAVVA